ncbi:MAG: hypothetical protein R3E08_01180, partial [Thiotrichaceae bacterium]
MVTRRNVTIFAITNLAILIFIGIFYLPAIQYWWLEDDPLFLQGIAKYGVLAHFYRPEVWQDLMPYHLMPWVIASFGIDWQLFGLNPSGFYWHHFISFALMISIAYKVLRLFFPIWICGTVLIVFVVSLPSGYALQLLMVRHYIEGLGLSLLAYWFYIKALQTHRTRWAYLGSLFYLCATTAKEIYVPLVVVLPFLPIGNWQRRVKMLLPFMIVAFFYVVWRTYMLGIDHLFAGYDSITAPPLNWERFLALPSVLLTTLGWQTWGHTALVILTLLLVGIWFWQSPKYTTGYLIIWVLAVVLPLIPVLSILSPLNSRYLLLPWFLVCIGLAGLLQFLSSRDEKSISVSVAIMWIIGAISWTPSSQILTSELLKRNSIEGKFVLTASATPNTLFSPYSASWHYDALLWLKEHVLKQADTTKVCY